MFWEKEKFLSRVTELYQYRYVEKDTIDCFLKREDESNEVSPSFPDFQSEQTETFKTGEYWSGRDRYLWLNTKITLPAVDEHHKVVGYFDFGQTGDGNSSGTESLLYINEEPYHGLDANHKEIVMKPEWQGKELTCHIRLWSGMEAGGAHKEQHHFFNDAFLAVLHKETDEFYWRLYTAVETLISKSENEEFSVRLIQAIDASLNKIDWRNPGSKEFYHSISEANKILKRQLAALKTVSPVSIHTIGHTHIDVAWLWRTKHTREKTARSFSTVLALMDEYPEYTFLQTQPQLYSYLKKDFPEIYDRIKQKVKEGQWEVGGGMWLEADCNIPSGESLVRQLLHGYHFLKDEFDVESEYLWLPDVFGYSWALPQILRKSGIDTFMTTKISWSQYNRMPHDTFNWRGIDGTEILTHFITTPDQNGLWYYTYNGDMSPKSLSELWENYRNKTINQDLLIAYGYGDGGGGVTKEMLEIQKSAKEMPGLPEIKESTAKDYFNTLHQNIEQTDQYVHTWDGELYLEYHRGTYTSQAKIKKLNRQFEIKLKSLETYCSLMCLAKGSWRDYPQEEIHAIWEVVLRNQFHDIIPGTSIKEVYVDAYKEYEWAEKQITAIYKTLNTNQTKENVLFNPLSFKRSGHTFLAEDSQFDSDNTMETQNTSDGTLVFLKDVNPYSFVKKLGNGGLSEKIKTGFIIEGWKISTPYYTVTFNEFGQIESLYDKRFNKEWIEDNKVGNEFQIFEDKPLTYDAWDIDLYYQQKQYPVTHVEKMEWIEEGPLRASLRLKIIYQHSEIDQTIHFYKNSPRIDFKTEIEWKEAQQLLKVAFPVTVRSTEATYDIQFGNVKRPTHWNTSWDYAKFETVAHKWADLSERNFGVALLNDCKYGYDIKDNIMRLSLIKSGIHPDLKADQGHHSFSYSLLPHVGDWYEGNVEKEAWDLNNPMTLSSAYDDFNENESHFEVDSDNVFIDTIKKAEKDNKLIIRLYEYAGATTEVNVSTSYKIQEWIECDLMERPLSHNVNTDKLSFDMKPYEIKTFLVSF
ncbi:alpha-mannosidase [Alkalibacterium sp. 20]|uniref:alpha-mannosidase n=1 Tax=Alkalibacterium sp. 20 TaxID=1798803 RepID=UPI0008FFFE86|nr:alpha-mannosidase [Alkalibacterium sp. 20]OJF92120.1 alpha-mannosidase [Alkalibacterium sp. 20]